MNAVEVAALLALQQFAQAVSALLAQAGPTSTNPWAKIAASVGAQLAANVAAGAAAALVAAKAEFTATNNGEKAFVQLIGNLPPIT